jgi:hypothetical protein
VARAGSAIQAVSRAIPIGRDSLHRSKKSADESSALFSFFINANIPLLFAFFLAFYQAGKSFEKAGEANRKLLPRR